MPVDIFYSIAALVIAVVLHELAHGVVAFWLGDNTARLAGRLTLNPFKHIDRTGSLALPLLLAIGQLATIGRVVFLFGWAKPIPVNAAVLSLNGVNNPRRLMALVALAGPASNFIQAAVGMLAIDAGSGWAFWPYFVAINLVLGFFNLLPVPPLDGGRIAVGLLPLPLAKAWARVEPYGISVMLLLLWVVPAVCARYGVHFDPIHDFLNSMLRFFGPA